MITLIAIEPGEWESTDGRVKIHHDPHFETWCDEPHAMRVRADHYQAKNPPYGAKRSTKFTKKDGWVEYVSWHCPGNEEHNYSMWTIEIDGDWTEEVVDTFTQARGVVEKLLGVPTKLGRAPKPKTERVVVPDPVTGIGHWKACGHRSELDINEHCYTCHQPVEVAA